MYVSTNAMFRSSSSSNKSLRVSRSTTLLILLIISFVIFSIIFQHDSLLSFRQRVSSTMSTITTTTTTTTMQQQELTMGNASLLSLSSSILVDHHHHDNDTQKQPSTATPPFLFRFLDYHQWTIASFWNRKQQQQQQHLSSLTMMQQRQQQKQHANNNTSQDLTRRNVSRNLCGVIPTITTTASSTLSSLPDAKHHHHHRLQESRILSSPRLTLPTYCSTNAILYMVQKGTHSSYGRNSTALFISSLDLLYQNYLSIDNHYDNVDILIFHTGDYTKTDLEFLYQRYHHNVHFKLIDMNNTDYWTLPEVVRHDNVSKWAYPHFSIGYRHMIRWFALKLYDFLRDYATTMEGGCSYQYLMRLDEDSFIHSPIQYNLFDFMQSNNYSYAFRMCAYEMEMDVWDDYVDHLQYCNNHSGGNNNNDTLSSLLPAGVPYRQLQTGLCGFYNNFFILDVNFIWQPEVQQFLHWVDELGIMYRERYGDLQIQTIAVYAFLPPHRIHRFLDWSYEHITTAGRCPVYGAIQAGYLDDHTAELFDTFMRLKGGRRRCRTRKHPLTQWDLSPTYAHLPPPSWWESHVNKSVYSFRWSTFAVGDVENDGKGVLSG